MTLTLRYAARSDVGLIRSNNQDAVYAGPRLLAVADGMGGHAAGDVASSVTIAAVSPLDDDAPPSDLIAALEGAIHQANDTLRAMVEAEPELVGMGTTLTALLCAGQRLALAHIGDSRAYLLRNGSFEQITRDHTLVQDYVDEGRISPDEAMSHPQRSLLTRALDGNHEVVIDSSIRDVRAGDRYLLCTDGLTTVASNDTIHETLAIPDPQQAADALVDLALRGGGPDNVTCVVADVVDIGPGTTTDEPVIGGAAAMGPQVRSRDTRSAAARAAALKPQPPQAESDDDGERRRRWPRWLGPLLVVVLLAVVGGGIVGGTYLYAQGQYYVGTQDGQVVIYRGINGSFIGLSFSSVEERTDIDVDSLPSFERDKVRATINAHSKADAERIVDQLHDLSGSQLPIPIAPIGPQTATPTPTQPTLPSPAGGG